MGTYSNILLAVELLPEIDKHLVNKAIELSKTMHAKIHIVHAIEHISSYGAAYGIAIGSEVEDILLSNSKKLMSELGEKLSIPKESRIIKFGVAKTVILEEANKLNCDLIIVGSHGRNGIRLLLGSTANAVLHGAEIDVLAVRLKS